MKSSGIGPKTIDVATLRTLLPMWMRATGFAVDDSGIAGGLMFVDAGSPGWSFPQINGYIRSMLRGLRITDGELEYAEDQRSMTVKIRIDYGGDIDV